MKKIFFVTIGILFIFIFIASEVVETTRKDIAKKNLTLARSGKWKVWGRVLDHNNKGISGLFVQAYDKDMLYDDLLGTAKTDANGNFEIFYDDKDFNDLFEKSPDLYLTVKNKKGKILFSSKKKVRLNAKKSEKFDIILKLILNKRILPVKRKI